ncbi:hypothetical protein EYF80_006935 [Liparis tanakae]|uniref:Uncharacterized protein n=1 Tax=Liparis tanakae TaxID=230148 RepID=A0A4Z2IZW8_9TELE|nr:hypothetical protein EYF80_006935 [Liparis tanakae]
MEKHAFAPERCSLSLCCDLSLHNTKRAEEEREEEEEAEAEEEEEMRESDPAEIWTGIQPATSLPPSLPPSRHGRDSHHILIPFPVSSNLVSGSI